MYIITCYTNEMESKIPRRLCTFGRQCRHTQAGTLPHKHTMAKSLSKSDNSTETTTHTHTYVHTYTHIHIDKAHVQMYNKVQWMIKWLKCTRWYLNYCTKGGAPCFRCIHCPCSVEAVKNARASSHWSGGNRFWKRMVSTPWKQKREREDRHRWALQPQTQTCSQCWK